MDNQLGRVKPKTHLLVVILILAVADNNNRKES